MHFDAGKCNPENGVSKGDRRMSQSSRVDKNAVDFFGTGTVNCIDQLRFAVRLQAGDGAGKFLGDFFQSGVYFRQGEITVYGSFSSTEQIEIWPVKNEKFQFKPDLDLVGGNISLDLHPCRLMSKAKHSRMDRCVAKFAPSESAR